MSIVSGIRSGLLSGIRSGLNPSKGGNPMAGVTFDAASGKYFPSTAAEWAIVLGICGIASGGPSAVHPCQDAAGNLADAVGAFPLISSGAGGAYQQAVAGFTRKAVTTTSGTTQLWQSTDASLPDLASANQLSFMVAKVTTTAARKDILGLGATGTPMMVDTELTTGFARAICNSNVATGAIDSGGVVRPWTVQSFRSSSIALVTTDAEKLLPTFIGTVAGKGISIGNYKFGAPTQATLWIATFNNAAAALTAAQIKLIWQTLGWTILW